MTAISFILYIQHDLELSDYRLSHIGSGASYWNETKNQESFATRARLLYWPLVNMLNTAIRKNPADLNLTLSFGGNFLQLAQNIDSAMFKALQNLVSLPNITLACTPQHGGLSFLSSASEFQDDLLAQRQFLKEFFKKDATIAHTPHIIYSDYVGKIMSNAGFSAAITDGWDPLLPTDANANHTFHHPENSSFKVLASNYNFTEDFNRYCARRNTHHFAVSPERYLAWIQKVAKQNSEVVTTFLDLSGPGAENSEVLCFLSDVFSHVASEKNLAMISAESAAHLPSQGAIHCPALTSNALPSHDVARWMRSALQQDILDKLNNLAPRVRRQKGHDIVHAWRGLFAMNIFESLQIHHYNEDNMDTVPNQTTPYDTSLSLYNILEDIELVLNTLECENQLTKKTEFTPNNAKAKMLEQNAPQ